MVFNATFNNISVISLRSVFWVEETGIPREMYHLMLYRVHLVWAGFERTMLVVIETDGIGRYKSNYHTITTTTAPHNKRFNSISIDVHFQVWIQDFKSGGGALKKFAPIGDRRENIWGISCEKSRFYAKKIIFFLIAREARKCLGYFVWKITILHQKILFFPILGGSAPGAPPLDPPLIFKTILTYQCTDSDYPFGILIQTLLTCNTTCFVFF